MLIDRPLREILDAFAAPDPTPGGGSASALASSIGVSLLLMVAALPKTRSPSDADRTALDRAAEQLRGLRQPLTEAIDRDAAAYGRVVAAYRLPKTTDEEKRARKDAVQRALREATDVPLGVMRASAAALTQAALVAEHGYAAASSDARVAEGLLRAGLEGARLNVEVNLESIDDRPYVDAIRAELQRLTSA